MSVRILLIFLLIFLFQPGVYHKYEPSAIFWIICKQGDWIMNVEDLIKRIRVEGWCVIENVIPHAEVHHVRDSIQSTATSRSQSMVKGRNGLNGLIAYDQSIAPYLADERVMAINEAMFGKHVRISMTTGVVIEPGYPQSNLHSDYPFGQGYDFRIPAPYPDAPLQLTSLWMLTPFTETNGGTVLVPGSHRRRQPAAGRQAPLPDYRYGQSGQCPDV